MGRILAQESTHSGSDDDDIEADYPLSPPSRTDHRKERNEGRKERPPKKKKKSHHQRPARVCIYSSSGIVLHSYIPHTSLQPFNVPHPLPSTLYPLPDSHLLHTSSTSHTHTPTRHTPNPPAIPSETHSHSTYWARTIHVPIAHPMQPSYSHPVALMLLPGVLSQPPSTIHQPTSPSPVPLSSKHPHASSSSIQLIHTQSANTNPPAHTPLPLTTRSSTIHAQLTEHQPPPPPPPHHRHRGSEGRAEGS